MGLKGLLTPNKFGMGMPVHASPYTYGDLAFPDAKKLIYTYYTDPELAASILPSAFELDEKPIANMIFVDYTNSTCGAYTEVIQALNVTYEGIPGSYAVALYVSNDMCMIGAREKFGIPKMMGSVEFSYLDSSSIVASFERPAGVLLAQGVFSARRFLGTDTEKVEGISYTIRFIPPAVPGEKPALCEVMRIHSTNVANQIWEGTGTLTYTGRNDDHPLHKLPVKEMISVRWLPCAENYMYPSRNETFSLI